MSAKTRDSDYKKVKKEANEIILQLEENEKHINTLKQTIKAIKSEADGWELIHKGKETTRPKIKLNGKIITPTRLIKRIEKIIYQLQHQALKVKGRKRKTSKRRRKGKGNKANTRKKRRGKKCKTRGKKKSKKSNKNKTRRRRRN